MVVLPVATLQAALSWANRINPRDVSSPGRIDGVWGARTQASFISYLRVYSETPGSRDQDIEDAQQIRAGSVVLRLQSSWNTAELRRVTTFAEAWNAFQRIQANTGSQGGPADEPDDMPIASSVHPQSGAPMASSISVVQNEPMGAGTKIAIIIGALAVFSGVVYAYSK